MANYKYVTPYWRDSHEIFGEGVSAYTGTTFYILNYNNERAHIRIHFFDLSGNLLTDMEVDILTPPKSVLDMRIVDIIAMHDPSYRTTSNLRTGSMKIVSDVPLVISGKMYNGTSGSNGTKDDNVWSIPFEEVQLPDAKLEQIDPNGPIIDPKIPPDFGNYFNRRKIFPKPR